MFPRIHKSFIFILCYLALALEARTHTLWRKYATLESFKDF